ncbi:REST corepressor 1-like [Bufo gargarizans]|uniref:REST corepressor 1-like n=1 Tax=Bufo gargarizans TaxID=30331 RepID=UPI001CF1F946|nr:REST corepressor 1-like [Bufo gargarizans]
MMKLPEVGKHDDRKDLGALMWSPNKDITEAKLDEYITSAKALYGYDEVQALGWLLVHEHDMEAALADMPNFTPSAEEWTEEDKSLFEKAFDIHGKSFKDFQKMLPHKSCGSIVKFYYDWKKTSGKGHHARKRKHSADQTDNTKCDPTPTAGHQHAGKKRRKLNRR